MRKVKHLVIGILMVFGLTSCFESDAENAVEDIGEKIEETAEDASDKIEEASEN